MTSRFRRPRESSNSRTNICGPLAGNLHPDLLVGCSPQIRISDHSRLLKDFSHRLPHFEAKESLHGCLTPRTASRPARRWNKVFGDQSAPEMSYSQNACLSAVEAHFRTNEVRFVRARIASARPAELLPGCCKEALSAAQSAYSGTAFHSCRCLLAPG